MERQGCPSDQELSAFRKGSLPADSLAAVARHLETCSACLAALDTISFQENLLFALTASQPSLEKRPSHQTAALLAGQGETPPEVNTETLANAANLSDDEKRTQSLGGPEARRPGDDLGRYENLGIIKMGGMGVIYRARDPILGREVALKMMKGADLTRPEDVQRFLLEAQSVAQLKHENIVKIHEFGQIDGQPYFTMDIAERGSLVDHLARLQNDPRASVSLMAKVARAVHYVHEHKIVHRDLKPGNILVENNDKPLVSDFGLAKWLEGEADLTQPGGRLGTTPYMAPEQFASSDIRPRPPIDIWALGVILYELLTGKKPFSGRRREDCIQAILNTDPPRPRSLNPRLPFDLETIVLKCLDKNPARRYGSAALLADDLERWLRGEPIEGRRVPRRIRLGRWCRRHPVVTTTLGLLLIAGLLAVFLVDRLDPLRPVRLMQNELRLGRPVTILEGNRPKWFAWQLGETGFLPPAPGADFFSIQGLNASLLEVLPDPLIPSYRFRAKVRQEQGLRTSSEVGLAFCLGHYQGPRGPFLGFCTLTFNDLLDQSPALVPEMGLNKAPKGNPLQVYLHFFRNVDKVADENTWSGNCNLATPLYFQPSLKGDGTGSWRELSISVTPETIGFSFGNQEGTLLSRKDLLALATFYIREHDPDFDPAKIHLGDGLGLFCSRGLVSYKDIRVEPLLEEKPPLAQRNRPFRNPWECFNLASIAAGEGPLFQSRRK